MLSEVDPSRRLESRAVLRCHDGTLAIGPATGQPGDIVAVMLGCDVAIVLREASRQKFQVMGPAYCQGVMDGQALLGALPDHVDMSPAHNEWKSY